MRANTVYVPACACCSARNLLSAAAARSSRAFLLQRDPRRQHQHYTLAPTREKAHKAHNAVNAPLRTASEPVLLGANLLALTHAEERILACHA